MPCLSSSVVKYQILRISEISCSDGYGRGHYNISVISCLRIGRYSLGSYDRCHYRIRWDKSSRKFYMKNTFISQRTLVLGWRSIHIALPTRPLRSAIACECWAPTTDELKNSVCWWCVCLLCISVSRSSLIVWSVTFFVAIMAPLKIIPWLVVL